MKISNTSERLKEIMDLKNLKQVDILKTVENQGGYISKSALSQYVNGISEPDQPRLTMLSKALNVSETWLMGYDEPIVNRNREELNIDNLIPMPQLNKQVPLLGTIAAGVPILADENVETYVDLNRTVSADFCLRVKGDSMINASINDGDIVFIKRQSDVDDGEIAAVLINDEATLKRVYKMAGKVVLRAENPKYKPIELNGEENVIILGKATYSLKTVL